MDEPLRHDDGRAGKRVRGRLRLAAFALIAIAFLLPHVYLVALRVVPVPITANMLLNDRPLRRDRVALEDVSPHLVRAVIGAEDARFCAHRGIDWEALRDVLDAPGRPARGASTLSQQTAKNVFLWNGGGYVRKAAEAWFALLGDAVWGKRRTLEIYLDVAEWGDGIYGAEAAARARFGTSAADLTPRQAALLAAVLPSPDKWRVDPPGPYVSERASRLRSRAELVASEGLDDCVLD